MNFAKLLYYRNRFKLNLNNEWCLGVPDLDEKGLIEQLMKRVQH